VGSNTVSSPEWLQHAEHNQWWSSSGCNTNSAR